MQKIIAAFDGLKYSASTQDYAIELAAQNNAALVGIFLDNLEYHSYTLYDLISEKKGGVDTKLQERLDKNDSSVRRKAIIKFESVCRKAGIRFSVHNDHRAAIRDLISESIYADLLIINRNETFSHFKEKLPTTFIQGVLSHVQCPVFVVPSSYRKIDETVLLYNGEPSSVYAIKMLSYVLPSFQQIDTEILTVNKPGKNPQLPTSSLIKEFISQHFSRTKFYIKKGDAESLIPDFLRTKKTNTLVVLGAYQRSNVSRLFKTSMADVLIRNLELPLFIAHNK